MAEEKKQDQAKETVKPANPQQGPFIHRMVFHLVGGQSFTLDEVSDKAEPTQNVVAFINAWREKKDVWHSPNNDPHFGVRVKDVSLYEYRVAQAQPAKAEEEKKESDKAN